MFEDGTPSGFGKMETAAGDYVECHWKNGVPHGEGWIKLGNHERIKALWKNGTLLKKGN